MRKAILKGIEYCLPDNVLTNEELVLDFPDWTADKISEKTGIGVRHIAQEGECASDLAERAANKLFAAGVCSPEEVEFILLCTQSPDYILPTTACILQERLGIGIETGALDFNLGCSGYIYGLSLAKGLIETGQVNNVLLLTAETYSKYINPSDISVKTIFGDAASATFLTKESLNREFIGPFVFGTDGAGKDKLIVKNGASRFPNDNDDFRTLYMNGPEIFSFTIKTVQAAVNKLLEICGKTLEEVDYFIFHQANEYILSHLRKKIGIPVEKFCIDMFDCGNTVSSSIPIALSRAINKGVVKPGMKVVLVGFGVGYSWGTTVVEV